MISFSSIVLLGNLNPAIFHPQWFERYNILPLQDIQSALGERGIKHEVPIDTGKLIIEEAPPILVTPNRTELHFPQLRFIITNNRYICQTREREAFQLLKEATLKIFVLLSHTPIRQLGINFEGHWKLDSDANEILKDLFSRDQEKFSSILGDEYEIGGVIVYHKEKQKITLRLENSPRLENAIFWHANFHSELESQLAEDAIKLVDNYYDSNIGEILGILKKLIGEPKETWKHSIQKT